MHNPDNRENLLFDNSLLSCLSFKSTTNGQELINFLNNLLISDLKILENNQFHYSALCNPKGRIISTFWIFIENNSQIYLFCPIDMQEILLSFFNARKFRLKININSILKSIYIKVNTNELKLVNSEPKQLETASREAFYMYLMQQNLVWVDSKNSEKFIPQHVNLDLHEDIMSFKKGCYPGQEIIARIKFLGKIKKRMRLIHSPDENALKQQLEKSEATSPIIYNKTENLYYIQAIKNII